MHSRCDRILRNARTALPQQQGLDVLPLLLLLLQHTQAKAGTPTGSSADKASILTRLWTLILQSTQKVGRAGSGTSACCAAHNSVTDQGAVPDPSQSAAQHLIHALPMHACSSKKIC